MMTAPAYAAAASDCTFAATSTTPCNTITGSGSFYPWLTVQGGPVTTPTASQLYGDQTGWSTTKGLSSTIMLNGKIVNPAGSGSSIIIEAGVMYSWKVVITVPTANVSTANLNPSVTANSACGNATLGNGQFSNPTVTSSAWTNNGNGTSSTTLTITTTNQSKYTLSQSTTMYISVGMTFTLPVLPGQTGNVQVTNPYTSCTGPAAGLPQYSRDVTWVANTLADPSGYKNGYWFTGTITTGSVAGPALTNGAASVDVQTNYGTATMIYTN